MKDGIVYEYYNNKFFYLKKDKDKSFSEIGKKQFNYNSNLMITRIKDTENEIEIIYRKNNEIKYKIITDTEIKKEKFCSYFLPDKQDKPAIIEKDNSIIINSLYNNNFIELKSENNRDFSLTNISEKDKFKEIINKNFDFFLSKVDFLNDKLGQTLANLYMLANFSDNNRIFFLFYSEKTQPKSLKDFQEFCNFKQDGPDFKVGIIGNKKHNHSLCIVIPNNYIYPEEKCLLFDSSFAKNIKIKDNLYTDLNDEILKDLEVADIPNLQHGNSCTLFAMLFTKIIAENCLKFEDILKYKDKILISLFKEIKEYETKYPNLANCEDEYGRGLFCKCGLNGISQIIVNDSLNQEMYFRKFYHPEKTKVFSELNSKDNSSEKWQNFINNSRIKTIEFKNSK